jgi:hypothetical protein
MRTHLQFRSPRFIGGPNSINPEIDGAKLADFLEGEFRAQGYDTRSIEEDWGWMTWLSDTPFRLWLGCSSYDEPDGWLVFIEPSKPAIRKWFRKIDTRHEVEKIAALLEKILTENGDATDLKWWSDHDSGRR